MVIFDLLISGPPHDEASFCFLSLIVDISCFFFYAYSAVTVVRGDPKCLLAVSSASPQRGSVTADFGNKLPFLVAK